MALDKSIDINDKITEVMTRRRAAQFAFLKYLVGLNTEITSATLAKAAEKLAVKLEKLGFEVERHAVPVDKAESAARPAISNLVVRSKFGDGPVLALVSHVDTVPAGAGWTGDARAGQVKDGRMYGRGTVSGKGHLAAQVFAVLALSDIGAAIGGSVELHISFDGEQNGLLGAKWMLKEKIVAPDFAIVGGPARRVVIESTGKIGIDVEVQGSGGSDPLEAANQALTRLYQFRGGLAARKSKTPGVGARSLTVEYINAGTKGGVTPDKVSFSLLRSLLPDEDPAMVEQQLTNLIGTTIAKVPGARCRIRRTMLIAPMNGNDDLQKQLGAMLAWHLTAKLGAEPERCGVDFDHEGHHYAAAKIPTVLYGAGPLDPAAAGLNGANEFIVLDDLRLGTEILALSIADLLPAG